MLSGNPSVFPPVLPVDREVENIAWALAVLLLDAPTDPLYFRGVLPSCQYNVRRRWVPLKRMTQNGPFYWTSSERRPWAKDTRIKSYSYSMRIPCVQL